MARGDAAAWSGLRDADLRLASLVYRLAIANTQLCSAHQAATGLIVQTLDQYQESLRPSAKAAFRFESSVSVEAVIGGSPADLAGILANDGIETIARQLPANPTTSVSTARRDSAESLLAALPTGKPVDLTIVRNGAHIVGQLVPLESCRAHAELVTDSGFGAQSDDQRLQVGIDYLARFDDNELAVLVAHELAHIILRHTERLEAVGIHHGLLQDFGRNACTIRQAETEADRFSMWLLANAGFDPEIGPHFWRGHGMSISGGIFRSATHESAKQRAQNLDDEIQIISHNAMHMPDVVRERFNAPLGTQCV